MKVKLWGRPVETWVHFNSKSDFSSSALQQHKTLDLNFVLAVLLRCDFFLNEVNPEWSKI